MVQVKRPGNGISFHISNLPWVIRKHLLFFKEQCRTDTPLLLKTTSNLETVSWVIRGKNWPKIWLTAQDNRAWLYNVQHHTDIFSFNLLLFCWWINALKYQRKTCLKSNIWSSHFRWWQKKETALTWGHVLSVFSWCKFGIHTEMYDVLTTTLTVCRAVVYLNSRFIVSHVKALCNYAI